MVYLNTLYVTSDKSYVRLEGQTVVVCIEDSKRLQVPLHHLGGLVLGDTVRVSAPLLNRCADDGLSIVWLKRNGRFGSRLEGPTSGNVLLRLAQYKAHIDDKATISLARAFVEGKLANLRQVVVRARRESDSSEAQSAFVQAARSIDKALRNLGDSTDLAEIRGREGQGSSAYFAIFQNLIKERYHKEFQFSKRQRRPPPDPVNALLSFAYALLAADCRSALETVGLDPQLGFLHRVRPGRASLALDLMEEFRAPLADRLVLTLINRGQLSRSDFAWRPGGCVELSENARRTLIGLYQSRKKESLTHPVLNTTVPIGVLPMIQARFLARVLRGDTDTYVPFVRR